MRMEDPVRHADYRFRSRVRAWRWRRVLWGGHLSTAKQLSTRWKMKKHARIQLHSLPQPPPPLCGGHPILCVGSDGRRNQTCQILGESVQGLGSPRELKMTSSIDLAHRPYESVQQQNIHGNLTTIKFNFNQSKGRLLMSSATLETKLTVRRLSYLQSSAAHGRLSADLETRCQGQILKLCRARCPGHTLQSHFTLTFWHCNVSLKFT